MWQKSHMETRETVLRGERRKPLTSDDDTPSPKEFTLITPERSESARYSREEGRPSLRCFKTVLAGFLAHGSSI